MEKTYTRARIIAATQKKNDEIVRIETRKRAIDREAQKDFIDMHDVVNPMDHY